MESRRGVKLVGIILSLSIAASLWMQHIAIDSFAPQHVATVVEILNTGEISRGAQSTPLFYLLGAIAVDIVGIAPPRLMYFPLQAIPFLVILYTLLYKISNKAVIAAGLVAVHFLSGLDGSSTLYFWSHGMGQMLYLALLLSLLFIVEADSLPGLGSTKRFRVIPILVVIVIPWFSYNLWAIASITLGALSVTAPLVRDGPYKVRQTLQFLFFGLLSVIVYIPLSRLVFGTAIPLLLRVEAISSTDKFMSLWLSSPTALPAGLQSVSFSRPPVLTYIAAAKYLVFGIVILSVLLAIYHAFLCSDRQLSGPAWVVHSAIVGIGGFMILRVFVGSLAIPWLHWAGLFGIALLARSKYTQDYAWFASHRHQLATVAVVILLIQAPLYNTVATQSDSTLKTDGFSEVEATSGFLGIFSNDEPTRSSVFTRYLIGLFLADSGFERHGGTVVSTEEVIALRNGDDVPSGYWIFNYELNHIALMNWVSLDSWTESRSEISSNKNIEKIYTSNDVEVYISS